MKVHLTFDVEVWCDGWSDLDAKFPTAFDRYVYGRSRAGDYALPKTLEILGRHGLVGVFFVEPMFSARFGDRYLARIVHLIESAGHDVQLHLHPEWTDEIVPPPIADVRRKRQHLCHYSRSEQEALLRFARSLIAPHLSRPLTAFRAGSYAVNRDSYAALAEAGILVDSSLNRVFDVSGSDISVRDTDRSMIELDGVRIYPVTVFRDGLGRLRPAQVNACGVAEMQHALIAAEALGRRHFVIVSHNFELLKPSRADPDWVVVRRFDALCEYLARNRDRFDVCCLPAEANAQTREPDQGMPRVPVWSTLCRMGAQAARQLG